MTREDELGHLAKEGLEDADHAGPHIADERLAQVAEGRARPTRQERHHLAYCGECRDVLGASAAQYAGPEPKPFTWTRPLGWLVPGLAVAAAALLMLRGTGVEDPGPTSPQGTYNVRGTKTAEAASVTVVGISATGDRRDLDAKSTLTTADRLHFRYGNPTGKAQRLTILGYDGKKVHWYYPAEPSEQGIAVQGGPAATALDLPEDVLLRDHNPGRLTIVAAFDVSPKALAERLRNDEPALSKDVLQLKVELRPAAQ